MIETLNIPAIVIRADATEQELFSIAREAAALGHWHVGECASKWLMAYAKGRSDEAFGQEIDMPGQTVAQCRRVFERFETTRKQFPTLRWTHFRTALAWDDAHECLKWAEEAEATVSEMKAWRRAQRGEDLFAEAGAQDEKYPGISENTGKTPKVTPKPAKPEGRTIHRSVDEKQSAGESDAHAAGEKTDGEQPSPDPETVVAMAIRKIDELIGFVVANGSDQERTALREQLQSVVDLLSPAAPDGPKSSLAMANVVVNEWNMIDGIVRCKAVTPKRRSAINVRTKDPFWREHWRAAIDKIRSLKCLHGANDRNWQADIDWFLRPDTVAQVIEGKYDSWTQKSKLGVARIRSQQNGVIKYDD